MDDEEPLYVVQWTETALTDLANICSFIANDNPPAAERVGRGILEHVRLLGRFPFIGPIYPLSATSSVREIVFRRTYRIFYSVSERAHIVGILRVWHGARDEPELPDASVT